MCRLPAADAWLMPGENAVEVFIATARPAAAH